MIIFGRLNESVIGAGVDVSEAPAIVTTIEKILLSQNNLRKF